MAASAFCTELKLPPVMHERFLLKALKYSKADSFNFSRPADFRSLVLWLENTKASALNLAGITCSGQITLTTIEVCTVQIRQLKIEERKPLGQFSDPQWDRTFQQVGSNINRWSCD